ncbi:MAG: hypothetical protein AAF206_27390 [Bacteroidota bacterium]
MNSINKLLHLLAILLLSGITMAQNADVSIVHNRSQLDQVSLQQLWQVDLINHTAAPLEVYLVGRIERNQMIAYQAQSRPHTLQPGRNALRMNNFPGLQVVQSVANPEQIQTWDGQIGMCIDVYNLEKQLLASSCQETFLTPRTPPRLVYPFDGDEIHTPIPTFTWLGPSPLPKNTPVRYTLKIVEDNGSGNPGAGPLFFVRENLAGNAMPYPISARAFDAKKTYFWQVEAFANQQSLGKTEVWQFLFPKAGEHEPLVYEGAFPELRPSLGAGYFLAKGLIRFRFDCEYQEKEVIKNLQILDNKGKEQRVDAQLFTAVGDNRFVLELPASHGWKDQAYYTLAVTDGKGRCQKLRFKYQNQ